MKIIPNLLQTNDRLPEKCRGLEYYNTANESLDINIRMKKISFCA